MASLAFRLSLFVAIASIFFCAAVLGVFWQSSSSGFGFVQIHEKIHETLPLCNGSAVHAQGYWTSTRGDGATVDSLLNGPRADRYLRTSGCSTLPLLEAMCRLEHNRLHVVGDSTQIGSDLDSLWLQLKLFRGICRTSSPDFAGAWEGLSCSEGVLGRWRWNNNGMRTRGVFQHVVERRINNIMNWNETRRKESQWWKRCHQNDSSNGQGFNPYRYIVSKPTLGSTKLSADVLIVHGSVWFNYSPSHPYDGEFDGLACVIRMLNDLKRAAETKHPVDRATWTRNAIVEGVLGCCKSYRPAATCTVTGLARHDHFHWTLVLAELAEFVVQYRKQLPRLIVWVHSTPQHFEQTGVFPGWGKTNGTLACGPHPNISAYVLQWRKLITTPLLDAMWPVNDRSILRVSVDEILQSRWIDHMGGEDCTHYQSRSPGIHEHLANILTAIVERLGKDAPHRQECTRLSMDGICATISYWLQIFVDEGVVFGVFLVIPPLGILIIIVGGIRWFYRNHCVECGLKVRHESRLRVI